MKSFSDLHLLVNLYCCPNIVFYFLFIAWRSEMRNDWNKLYLEFPKGNFLVAKATLELAGHGW